jgi:hypothetical protein
MVPTVSENVGLAASGYQGYPGSFDDYLRTPKGGSNMMLDYGLQADDGQGVVDTWNNNSMHLLPGILSTNQVLSLSLPFESSPVRTDGVLYSQTPPQYSQTESSYTDNVPQNIRLENITIHKRSDAKCTWPGCGIAFQDSTRLRRHEKIHSAPDKRKCELCHTLVTGADGLERHYRRHVELADKYPRLEYFEEARDKMTGNTRK